MAANTMKTAFKLRLNEVLDDDPQMPKGDGRQAALGRALKVSQAAARKWLMGEALPETSRLSDIAVRWGVSFEWLLTGRGPKYPMPGISEAEALSALQRRYLAASVENRALIEHCLQLPPSVLLPPNVGPTLTSLLDTARLMIQQNLPRA